MPNNDLAALLSCADGNDQVDAARRAAAAGRGTARCMNVHEPCAAVGGTVCCAVSVIALNKLHKHKLLGSITTKKNSAGLPFHGGF